MLAEALIAIVKFLFMLLCLVARVLLG